MTKTDLKFFKDNGYLLKKGIFPIEFIQELLRAIEEVVRIEIGFKNDPELKTDDLLNSSFINLLKKYPHSSSWINETMLNHHEVKRLLHSNAVMECVCELIDVPSTKFISVAAPVVRFDVPEDTRFVKAWHQDSGYYPETDSGEKTLVAWIPLADSGSTVENGTLIICPKSHKKGKLKDNFVKGERHKTSQHHIPQEALKGFVPKDVIAKQGDVVFMNNDMFHKSGYNSSNTVRYTAQIRYSDIRVLSFTPGKMNPTYMEFKRD